MRYASDITSELQVEIMTFGQQSSGRVTERVAIRRAALPAEGGAPPQAADLLITPGKGIGVVTLEMPVADVTGRLGTPSGNAPDGTMWGRRPRLSGPGPQWRGLVGYLDPADDTKLVALGVADRRYRTAKGVGFGSAHGAVLFAHGMTPPRVEMRGAGMVTRVLVYEEEGIAFGFTSDKTHPGGAQAPLGSVDWVIVFAPGGAAKVFTMP